MMKRVFHLFIVLFSVTILCAQTPILGNRITMDNARGKQMSMVRIYKFDNGKYYGEITQLLGVNANAICEVCIGSDYKKPIVGLVIIRDMELVDGELRNGRVLDPDNGKFYYAKIYLKDGKLV